MTRKKKRRCGACGERGHNVRTCPNATYRDKLVLQDLKRHERVTYTLVTLLNDALIKLGQPGATLGLDENKQVFIEGQPELTSFEALAVVKFILGRGGEGE